MGEGEGGGGRKDGVGLPSTRPCVILPLNADRRRKVMDPIQTAAALFDQGYA